ncbi:hypothetical protein Bca52824_091721 [Brassica carinata]|uniref:Uncharacterized protein n=1 Tax=Brassica carinata TaxID=52824 RepID=A0A8X7TEV2_BRACI|nr:hypothetical protein Bca52824_091721 [Brassica carinata]
MDSTEAIDGSSLPGSQSGAEAEQSSVSLSYLVDNSTDSVGSVQKIQSVSARSSSPLTQSQVGEAKLAVFTPVSGESQLASTTVAKLDDPGEKEFLLLPLSSSQILVLGLNLSQQLQISQQLLS